jgi:signal transduction histidine kinase
MRRFVPDSLAASAIVIVIVGLSVTALATFAATVFSRAETARMMGFFHLAERVSSVTRAVVAASPRHRPALVDALSNPTVAVTLGDAPLTGDAVPADDELAELEDIIEERLVRLGIADVQVERRAADATAPASPPAADDAGRIERVLSEIGKGYARDGSYVASIELPEGGWLNFVVAMAPAAAWPVDSLVLAGLIAALVVAVSLWALRRLTAPYDLLAAAAERFGLDLHAPSLPERGPREIRAAAHAFNLMQERLRRVIGDRDQLAAAISHDLRTPVTRLRLRAEFIDTCEQRERMLADLDEIEIMTRSVLAFARDSAQPELRETVDLVSLVETLCEELPSATFTEQTTDRRLPYRAEPVALRRAIANLVDNAVRYGGGAHVSLCSNGDAVRIAVEDNGPGIPEEEIEAVFRPFRRLETSRNRETGGTGLGLTIARSVARSHGGDIVLSPRDCGGLRAEIVLPLPAGSLSPAFAGSG